MTPKQFKPIITKVLKDSATKKFSNVESLADAIVQKMEQFEEMADLLIVPSDSQKAERSTISETAAQNFEDRRQVLLPGESTMADISERMVVGREASGGIKEHFTKPEILAYLTEKLPVEFGVQPAGFAEPVKLVRRLQMAPGDLSFVKVLYIPAGAAQGIEVQVSTTESKIDDVAILKSIEAQAAAVLRPQRVTIQPRMMVPPPASLSPDPAFSVETDRETSGSDADQWRKWAIK